MVTASRFWAMARRPRWIAALVLALAIAAAFAALGQWQLSRSLEGGDVTGGRSETVVPLTEFAQPQLSIRADQVGQRASASGRFVPEDFLLLSDRINFDGPGYWVVGHLVTDRGASLAVALGWAPTATAAEGALEALRADPPTGELEGRYLGSESPEQSDFEAGQRSAMAVPELINLWSVAPDGVYAGYLVLADAPAGLEAIDAPAPDTEVSLNLLNVFYAVEWVIFAGFAIFLWYRLVRDAIEEEDAAEGDPGRP